MLTGEQQNKITQGVPILGMLQASKAFVQSVNGKDTNPIAFDNNHIDHGDGFGNADHLGNIFPDIDNNNVDLKIPDKNPIINKRILLGNDAQFNDHINEIDDDGNVDEDQIKHIRSTDEFNNVLNNNNTDQIVIVEVPQTMIQKDVDTKAGAAKIQPSSSASVSRSPTEGRVAVYGDSNCLDSTHMEKPCFWLLDALLEYTMTSHVSTLLKDLNRSASIVFQENVERPTRLPNNNLHMYSKVLENSAPINGFAAKREIPQCTQLRWETPVFLNVTAPSDLYHSNNREADNELDGNGAVGALRRRLESQKGEVRSG